jgi:uncharacterized membrane protein YccC
MDIYERRELIARLERENAETLADMELRQRQRAAGLLREWQLPEPEPKAVERKVTQVASPLPAPQPRRMSDAQLTQGLGIALGELRAGIRKEIGNVSEASSARLTNIEAELGQLRADVREIQSALAALHPNRSAPRRPTMVSSRLGTTPARISGGQHARR